MKFIVTVPGMTLYPGRGRHWWERITSEEMKLLASETDRLGYDAIRVSTHFVMNAESAREMGSRWVHSLSATGFLMGATERIRFVPLLVVPYHNPIELAKAIATLDFVSGGRITPLAMVGYKHWEYELLRVPFADRGTIMDESLGAMIELWTSDEPRCQGRHVSFDDIVFDPKPTQQPMPLWLGGRTKPALRRVARFGDGFYGQSISRDDFPWMVEYIIQQPDFQARPRPLELSLPLFEGRKDPITHVISEQAPVSLETDAILEQVQIIAGLGATITDPGDVLGIGQFQNDNPAAPPPTRDAAEFLERLQRFAEEVMPEAKRIGSADLTGAGLPV